MKHARFESDYAPGTFLRITQTEDGDIALRISGDSEFRIATSGGRLHGEELVQVCGHFSAIIDVLAQHEANERNQAR